MQDDTRFRLFFDENGEREHWEHGVYTMTTGVDESKANNVDIFVFSEKSHSDRFLRRCCSDGIREIPMPYSCRRRALYITENWSCVMAFLECCSKYRGEELGNITPPPPTTPEPPPTTPKPHFNRIMVRGESVGREFARERKLSTFIFTILISTFPFKAHPEMFYCSYTTTICFFFFFSIHNWTKQSTLWHYSNYKERTKHNMFSILKNSWSVNLSVTISSA